MRSAGAAVVLLVLTAAPLLAQNEQKTDTATAASHVTLPLAEYERLHGDRPENITVVDTLRLAGTFRDRNLSATFTGKSIGARAATPVLNAASGLTIWGCSGNAVISRGDKDFRITPLADAFTVTCRIAAPGGDRLELHGTSNVLAIESAVADGDLVSTTKGGDGSAVYSLVRQSSGGAENLAPTATGHYLITLLPDETRFRYAIDVHNPNRSMAPFEVRLRSGEHLQQVDTTAPYEVAGGAYRFVLPPGDTSLVMTGQLTGDAFTPPVDASLQYLAIENHPVVRPVIDGNVKRARHTFFIPAEGDVLGESIFAVDNQGASDVKLPLRPEPTFASIEDEPLLMTKGPDGKLTVPLSAGKQNVLVQHKQSIRQFLGFGFGRLVVPQLGVPATSLLAFNIQMRRQYDNLFTSGGGIGSVAEPPVVSGEVYQYRREAASNQNAVGLNVVGKVSKQQQASYQGLPARFEIPGGERHSYFGQEMLPTDREQAINVVLISSSIVWLIGMIFVALALWQLWRARALLAEGLRARFAAPKAELLPSS